MHLIISTTSIDDFIPVNELDFIVANNAGEVDRAIVRFLGTQ